MIHQPFYQSTAGFGYSLKSGTQEVMDITLPCRPHNMVGYSNAPKLISPQNLENPVCLTILPPSWKKEEMDSGLSQRHYYNGYLGWWHINLWWLFNTKILLVHTSE